MKRRKYLWAAAGLLLSLWPAAGQDEDGFGFGFGDEAAETAAKPGVKLSGEVSTKILGYGSDFRSAEAFKDARLEDIFGGKLRFAASAFNTEAVISLKLAPVFDDFSSAVSLDEAYLRVYLGNFDLEGGLRKLTWGKADSFGPLDTINPLDYRDLTAMTDLMGRKIARPMIHASYRLGAFSTIEGVFVPTFEAHRFAGNGRWTPSQVRELPASIGRGLIRLTPAAFRQAVQAEIASRLNSSAINDAYPSQNDLAALKYAQAGLRFTTSVRSSDFGLQYYFGRLGRPAVTVEGASALQGLTLQNASRLSLKPRIVYNPYHQIGADYARVIAGFNLRAEFAAHITGDYSGKDGSVYNPFLAWSLGFDRNLFWGVNLNLQATETIRLMNSGVKDNPALDTEAGTDMTSTRLTMVLSKKLLRDELELKTTGIWGVEDRDFLIIPAIVWTKWDLTAELSGGIFGGDEQGELGQYRNNNFFKTMLTYSF
ncbi:MAG: hypothetical protein LBD47_04730 [Treponema sp.]|jgi:hypothetical protein|nr:hypothetical protein [Treponema sp.]